MSTNVVNLDALMPREDLDVKSESFMTGGNTQKIEIPHLTGFIFGPDLRKPHFQRETNQWSPKKVVDLLTAFVDCDLIPAVILWRAGKYIFVVDGAHRLSAILAWLLDDYGDGAKSQAFFGGKIPDEQQRIAVKTRGMVNKAIGSFADYEQARKGVPKAAHIMDRLPLLSECGVIAQWVPAPDAKSAEDSFFKINQSASPIDPTERRLLKARNSASAIAARAITNAGTGHKYWGAFSPVIQAQVEEKAKGIAKLLWSPPVNGMPINTLDVPVAGKGYNALPFVFDLVNEVNKVGVADTTKKKEGADNLPPDLDGSLTLSYLKRVEKALSRITTDESGALGLHPVVYFYTRGGEFKAEAFFATHRFVSELIEKDRLKKFTPVRAKFEDFLIAHKEALGLMVHKYGTGGRSIPQIHAYLGFVCERFTAGDSDEQVTARLAGKDEFAFLTAPLPPLKVKKEGKMSFSTNTKTAIFFSTALESCPRCAYCDARLHTNSIHHNHKIPIAQGGHSGIKNGNLMHPYCDSIYTG